MPIFESSMSYTIVVSLLAFLELLSRSSTLPELFFIQIKITITVITTKPKAPTETPIIIGRFSYLVVELEFPPLSTLPVLIETEEEVTARPPIVPPAAKEV